MRIDDSLSKCFQVSDKLSCQLLLILLPPSDRSGKIKLRFYYIIIYIYIHIYTFHTI